MFLMIMERMDPSVKHWDDTICCKLTFTLWLYYLAAILNGYKVSFIVMCSSVKNKT
ncbi:hypothetical protein [Wolbachia endosymbiont (group A) of Anomoia purmunda]|uniref:hypothetical protein n=1 Tax=Wolbachia endosymbiont (group A) of Anomoia purmunda TaxID=2953978 RepID=UPI00222FED68|nr:hypothetical protein [Wolbachia endosymbiont (group A) of Anomoia purmunda]